MEEPAGADVVVSDIAELLKKKSRAARILRAGETGFSFLGCGDYDRDRISCRMNMA